MAELKTRRTTVSVSRFVNSIQDAEMRRDSRALLRMMQKITGEKPKMWGPSMVGFGSYEYKYKSGRQGEWFLTGFVPRKQALTLYIMSGFQAHSALLKKLGKYKTGEACLYIRRLEDVDRTALRELIHRSVQEKAQTGALVGRP